MQQSFVQKMLSLGTLLSGLTAPTVVPPSLAAQEKPPLVKALPDAKDAPKDLAPEKVAEAASHYSSLRKTLEFGADKKLCPDLTADETTRVEALLKNGRFLYESTEQAKFVLETLATDRVLIQKIGLSSFKSAPKVEIVDLQTFKIDSDMPSTIKLDSYGDVTSLTHAKCKITFDPPVALAGLPHTLNRGFFMTLTEETSPLNKFLADSKAAKITISHLTATHMDFTVPGEKRAKQYTFNETSRVAVVAKKGSPLDEKQRTDMVKASIKAFDAYEAARTVLKETAKGRDILHEVTLGASAQRFLSDPGVDAQTQKNLLRFTSARDEKRRIDTEIDDKLRKESTRTLVSGTGKEQRRFIESTNGGELYLVETDKKGVPLSVDKWGGKVSGYIGRLAWKLEHGEPQSAYALSDDAHSVALLVPHFTKIVTNVDPKVDAATRNNAMRAILSHADRVDPSILDKFNPKIRAEMLALVISDLAAKVDAPAHERRIHLFGEQGVSGIRDALKDKNTVRQIGAAALLYLQGNRSKEVLGLIELSGKNKEGLGFTFSAVPAEPVPQFLGVLDAVFRSDQFPKEDRVAAISKIGLWSRFDSREAAYYLLAKSISALDASNDHLWATPLEKREFTAVHQCRIEEAVYDLYKENRELYDATLIRVLAEFAVHGPERREACVKWLAFQFVNIDFLSRCSPTGRRALLQDMFSPVTDTRPVVLFVTTKADHNTAFNTVSKAVDEFVANGYCVRMVEADSDVEVLQRAMRAVGVGTEFYRPAETIVWADHSTQTEMSQGKPRGKKTDTDVDASKVGLNDERWLKAAGISKVLKPGGNVILIACESGKGGLKEDSIANMFRRLFRGSRVFAPETSTNVESWTFKDKKFDSVKYHGEPKR